MLQSERRLVTAHLEHAARACATGFGPAETGVEEARVMHPELADHGEIGRHLGGMGGRNRHRLAADENVEGAGVENDAAGAGAQLLPELGRVVPAHAVEVDDRAVGLRAVADEGAIPRHQIDREAESFGDHRRRVDQRARHVERPQRFVGQDGVTPAKTHLVQPHARPHEHRKRARADFGIERTLVAGRNPVELDSAVGDGAGEKIEPPRRGFGVGHGLHVSGKGEAFGERNNVDAALLQHRPRPEFDPVHLEIRQPIGHAPAMTGEKRGANAVGDGAETKVDRSRLDLGGVDCGLGGKSARTDESTNLVVWENPGHRRIRLRYREWSG